MLPLPDIATATRKRIVRKYKRSHFPGPRPFLHIRCGDDILGKLDDGGVPGDKIRWADALSEGPIRATATEREYRRARAAYLAHRYSMPITETYRDLLGSDLGVDEAGEYGEAVLWFEADLFDQIILVYLLARLAWTAPRANLSLVCIGRHPAVRRFIGLGQLRPTQLAALFPRRRRVTRGQIRLATAAWQALKSDDPRSVMELSRMRSRSLPFLPAALKRHLQQYPWVGDGLSLAERLALREVVAAGQITPCELFPLVQSNERRPFMGDLMFYATIRDLASGRTPLIASEGPKLNLLRHPELAQTPVHATRQGERVLHGRADWRQLNGGGKWIGGVYLEGSYQIWRWSPNQARIIRAGR